MATGDPGGGHPLQDDQSQSPHSLDPQRPVRRSVGNMLSVDNDDGNPAATPVYSYASAVNQGTPVSISSFSTGNARTRQLEEFAKTDSTDGGDDGMKDFPSTLSTENTTYQPTSIGMVDRSKPVQQPSGKFPQQTYSQAASTEAQSMQHCTSTAKLGTVDQDSRHSPSPGNDVQHRECSLTSHATSSATAVTLSSTTLLSESPNSAQLSVVCEGCDEDATCRCLTCQLSLCNECWEDMHRVKKRASHRKVDLLSTGPTRPSSQEPGPFLWDENVEDNYGKDKFDTKPLPAGNITKPFQVYHLIQLHHDLQEQGETVKKWLLDKKTFTRFTSSLGLAENKKSSWPVDSDLQARELATIGLYGNKERISEWLKQRISLCPTDVKMITDESRPGLYCLNNGGNVQYLVFNAPEDAFSSISRKNISCLLIRCLVELCRPLLVFYDKDELSSFKVLPNFGQADHQERMFPAIITRLTGEKTNISVKSGFQVDVSQVVPRLDGCDAGLCQNCSAIGCFHAGKHTAGRKKYGKVQTETITNPIKQPLQDLFEKMKVACRQLHHGEDLCFSKDEFLEATEQLHFDLTSVQSIADDPQQVSLDQKMHSTAKLYILENCHLACHFLPGIEQRTEAERATLEKHQSDVFEYIGQHAKDAKDESKNRRKTEELLQQAVSPLKNMDAAYGWCLQQIQDSTSVTGEKLQAMTRFILVSGKQDQLTKQLQLASVIGERDYDKVSLEAALKTSSQTRHYDAKSPLVAVFQDPACQEVAKDCLTQLVDILRKKSQPKQMTKAREVLSKLTTSKKSVAATQAKSRGQQTDTQHTPAQEKMELVRLAAERVKLHINPSPDLEVCFKMMAFNKTEMTLTVDYKMQLQPTCERLHSLYSLEVQRDELEHADQDPDYLPSANIKIRQANVPLQEEEYLRFITTLKTGKTLVVIQEAGKQTCGMHLLPAIDFSYTALPPAIFTTQRPINMLDFDEMSRLMVMHLPLSREVLFVSIAEDFSSAKSYGIIKYQGQAMGTSLKQLRL
eukprot:scpid35867/ scgid0109/ 